MLYSKGSRGDDHGWRLWIAEPVLMRVQRRKAVQLTEVGGFLAENLLNHSQPPAGGVVSATKLASSAIEAGPGVEQLPRLLRPAFVQAVQPVGHTRQTEYAESSAWGLEPKSI